MDWSDRNFILLANTMRTEEKIKQKTRECSRDRTHSPHHIKDSFRIQMSLRMLRLRNVDCILWRSDSANRVLDSFVWMSTKERNDLKEREKFLFQKSLKNHYMRLHFEMERQIRKVAMRLSYSKFFTIFHLEVNGVLCILYCLQILENDWCNLLPWARIVLLKVHTPTPIWIFPIRKRASKRW